MYISSVDTGKVDPLVRNGSYFLFFPFRRFANTAQVSANLCYITESKVQVCTYICLYHMCKMPYGV